ncbi:MAG: HipA domain-containing protein, partial [Actinobacteria bacterium]|nr:HipA domain-containing protein [Actinomycetota bacterium]
AAFVWVWLPDATDPVVAGRLDTMADIVLFTYGQSYLARPAAIPLYLPELPLQRGPIRPRESLSIAGCIRDAGPDAWGQRVILARYAGRPTRDSDTDELGLLSYLLESGSDRIGALDFQASPTAYVPRGGDATLAEMQTAAERLQAGESLSPELEAALLRGTSIGGARPKALLYDGGRQLIAKLSTATDPYPVVKAEGVAMELARRVGLDVAPTEVTSCLGRDVLLVERFDRHGPGLRRMMLSALTLQGLEAIAGRHATYAALADDIRHRFTSPAATLRELFRRIVFNVCVGNTDDHARNHSAFWDGERLTLTPAYDLCPQLRSGSEANQAMAIGRQGQRAGRLAVCRESADVYLLSRTDADAIIDQQVGTIREQWEEAADVARLTALDKQQMWARQIL